VSSPKRKIVAPSPRPAVVREIQLIDRDEEMQVLREAADRAVSGQGGVVFLYGEAGIGKTRLTRELEFYANSRGMQVLSGTCPVLFRMDGAPPYVLWREVIRNYFKVCTPEQLCKTIGYHPAEICKLVPELDQKLRVMPKSVPISPEHERNRLFEAVSQFITNISLEVPLVIVLDDLQWTDQSSLLLLHYLARGVYRESLLLVGAYRDTYIDKQHPLSPVLKELNRERLFQIVSLKRMSLNDVSEMIKWILERNDVSTEFCELVYEKTRGNPFFVEEVIKALKEDEVIFREKNRWKIREVSQIRFPETVMDVIKARVDRLDDECQRVLTLASFVGKDFTFEALCEVTSLEENKLLDIIEKMLKTGLIKEGVIRGEAIYSFPDVIVRDVLHDEVSLLKRKKLHDLVGCTLEKAYVKEIDEHFGELAYHFLESGGKEKALDYLLKAGEKAQKVYAHNEAFSYLNQALVLLQETGDDLEEKARITEKLGDLKAWAGEINACMENWNKSLRLLDQLGDKKSAARLHGKIASVFWNTAGDKEKASEHHRMALEILEKMPESVELAGLYEDISHMLWRAGKLAEALPWAQKAFELAKTLDAPEVLAGCYEDLGAFSLGSGDLEEARRHFEQGLKIAVENNCVEPALRQYENLSFVYLVIGELEKSFKANQKGSELAREVGDVHHIPWIETGLAVCYAFMGEIRKAISMFEDILALDKRTENTVHSSNPLWALGRCYCWLGEWDKSLQYLTEARDIARKTGEFQSSGWASLWLGELFLEMEDYVKAEKYLEESRSTWEKAGAGSWFIEVFPALSRLYLKKGEIEKAKELIERTHKSATETRNKLVIFYAEMLKAMIFREQKNWDQSIQLFEKSLQGYKSLNLQKWHVDRFAELLYEYSLMHLNRNEEGDKERAYLLLNQALEIYERMDAKKKIAKIKSLICPENGREIAESEPPAGVVFPEHISTGYEELDVLLFGGIPTSYAVILTAPSCDERDLLVKRFLDAGTEEGHVTFYITTKASGLKNLLEDFPSNFCLFICNPQADKIIKDAPNVFKLKGVENLTDINIVLSSAFGRLESLKGARRACIGIVSDILLQHHAVQTRRWLNALIPELRSKGFTTLAVMDPGMHSLQEVRAVLDLFEGEIDIYEKETEKGLEKFLKIKKMINQKYSKSELPLQ
jgi:adenylate cyclase